MDRLAHVEHIVMPPPVLRIIVLVSVAALLVGLAFVAGDARRSSAQSTPTVDYDLDDDHLIEVRTRAQWLAIHQDLDGSGNAPGTKVGAHEVAAGSVPTWASAFPNAATTAGCGSRDHDNNPATPDAPQCLGYELMNSLDFTGQTYFTLGKHQGFGELATTAKIVGNGNRIIGPRYRISSNPVGLIANVRGSVEGIGVIRPSFQSGTNRGSGIAGRLEGSIVGSFVMGGTTGAHASGGMVGEMATDANNGTAQVLIAHSFVDGTVVGPSNNNIGGLIGDMKDDHANGGHATCLNSYFSGDLNGRGSRGLISSGKGANATITACIGDNTTDSQDIGNNHNTTTAWNGGGRADLVASNAVMKSTDGYTGIYQLWDDYAADGTALGADQPPADFWDFGDSDTLPVLKAWGHDSTQTLFRATNQNTTVNLCTRTLNVANEIIRHLKDAVRGQGVAAAPAALTGLAPCFTNGDVREVTIKQLADYVVTTADHKFDISPDKTTPPGVKTTSLHRDDFAYLSGASHFDLGGNDLESVPPRLFQGVPLRWLDLSNNKLTSLHPDLFAEISSVSAMTTENVLLLNGNTLTETGIPYRLFDPLSRLNGLDLSDNAITRVNTRWFEALNNLGRKASSTPPYTEALGLHLEGNTITHHYYSTKLFTGVTENMTTYADTMSTDTPPVPITAGDALRTAIIAAITAANTSVANLELGDDDGDLYFTSGGTTTGYQDTSTVTACLGTQTAGPGRYSYVHGVAPACYIQEHWSPPHKSGDTATTTPTISNSVGARGRVDLTVSHTASSSFVAYQVRHKQTSATDWSPWQVVPITLGGGTKTLSAPAIVSGVSYDVELRALSTTGPPSAAATATGSTPAANWFATFNAATSSTAFGAIDLTWTAPNSSSLPTNHAIGAYYYRYKLASESVYGSWNMDPMALT